MLHSILSNTDASFSVVGEGTGVFVGLPYKFCLSGREE